MANSTDHLTNLRWTEGSVEMGDGSIVQLLNVGTLVLASTVNGIRKTVSIGNVAYVSNLTTNLLYVSCI